MVNRQIDLNCGHTLIPIKFNGICSVDIIAPPPIEFDPDNPVKIDFSPLYKLIFNNNVHASEVKIGIVINDKTRPVPYPILIPPLVQELINVGIGKPNITLFN